MDIENEINILLVEDNPGDVRLTREGLNDAKLRNELFVCNNGLEALDFYAIEVNLNYHPDRI